MHVHACNRWSLCCFREHFTTIDVHVVSGHHSNTILLISFIQSTICQVKCLVLIHSAYPQPPSAPTNQINYLFLFFPTYSLISVHEHAIAKQLTDTLSKIVQHQCWTSIPDQLYSAAHGKASFSIGNDSLNLEQFSFNAGLFFLLSHACVMITCCDHHVVCPARLAMCQLNDMHMVHGGQWLMSY